MTVPAIDTTKVATFAYYQQTGCTYVQLVDVLSILHSYVQHAEYVDGTIKIYDTGSESGAPNNYVLVNVRIRVDGWIMAWFPRTLATGTADSGNGVTVTDSDLQIQRNGESSPNDVLVNELAGYIFKPTSGDLTGNEYTIQSNDYTTITLHSRYGDNVSTDMGTLGAATYDIIQSRGNLVWWGHDSSHSGDPAAQTTRLGRALYEVWEALRTNQQGGSGASLSYSDVGYWDYEYPSATHLYMFGCTGYSVSTSRTYYCTIPNGVVVYSGVINYGVWAYSGHPIEGYIDSVRKYYVNYVTSGYVCIDQTSIFTSNYGVQKRIDHSIEGVSYQTQAIGSQAIILLTSG